MTVIIQCAKSKLSSAGHLKTSDGTPVTFVAHPTLAAETSRRLYARPDDVCETGRSWREELVHYNQRGTNPLGLLPACELYRNRVFRDLVEHCGRDNVYVLSAGWGLVTAAFRLPFYDITLSPVPAPDRYKRRRLSDVYQDFMMLPSALDEPVICFVSSKYVPLLTNLVSSLNVEKVLWYRSDKPPAAPGFTLRKYRRNDTTNWQFNCARSVISQAC